MITMKECKRLLSISKSYVSVPAGSNQQYQIYQFGFTGTIIGTLYLRYNYLVPLLFISVIFLSANQYLLVLSFVYLIILFSLLTFEKWIWRSDSQKTIQVKLKLSVNVPYKQACVIFGPLLYMCHSNNWLSVLTSSLLNLYMFYLFSW